MSSHSGTIGRKRDLYFGDQIRRQRSAEWHNRHGYSSSEDEYQNQKQQTIGAFDTQLLASLLIQSQQLADVDRSYRSECDNEEVTESLLTEYPQSYQNQVNDSPNSTAKCRNPFLLKYEVHPPLESDRISYNASGSTAILDRLHSSDSSYLQPNHTSNTSRSNRSKTNRLNRTSGMTSSSSATSSNSNATNRLHQQLQKALNDADCGNDSSDHFGEGTKSIYEPHIPDPAPPEIPPRTQSLLMSMQKRSDYQLKFEENGDQKHEAFIPQSQQKDYLMADNSHSSEFPSKSITSSDSHSQQGFGHIAEVCRKRQRSQHAIEENNRSIPREVVREVTTATPVTCYGCGRPGTVRSRCPTCSEPKKLPAANFCSIRLSKSLLLRDRPVVQISVNDVCGYGFIDTAARVSVASYQLYQRLKNDGYKFYKQSTNIILADGVGRPTDILLTEVMVNLQNHAFRITFLIMPESRDNRTLLGVDFIEITNIILNIPQRIWYFGDSPKIKFDLLQREDSESNTVQASVTSTSRKQLHTPKRAKKQGNLIPDYLQLLDSPQCTIPRPISPIANTPERVSNIISMARVFEDIEIAELTLVSTEATQLNKHQHEKLNKLIIASQDVFKLHGPPALLQAEASDERPIEDASRLLTPASSSQSKHSRFFLYTNGDALENKPLRQPHLKICHWLFAETPIRARRGDYSTATRNTWRNKQFHHHTFKLTSSAHIHHTAWSRMNKRRRADVSRADLAQ